MLRYGIISDVKKGFVKVFLEQDEIVTDWIPVLVRKSLNDKESFQLEVNEHVVCLMDEKCNEGVCLGAIPNTSDVPDDGEAPGKFRKKFADGTVIEYDRIGHKLTVDVKGELQAKTTGKALIEATGDVEVTTGANVKATAATKAEVTAPNIELTGAVKITGAVQILGALSAGAISTVAGAGGGSGAIEVQGNFSVTGEIAATGQIEGSDVKAGAISLLTHKHTAPSGGGATSTPIS